MTGAPARRAARAVAALIVCAATATELAAQDYRAWSTTQLRLVELRPQRQIPVERATVTFLPDGSAESGGLPVHCGPVDCFRWAPGEVGRAVVATEDVAVSAWGLGVSGLSATALLRGRAELGGDLAWPRSDDPFDALLAYAQIERAGWRVRLGRQEALSGLGFSGFDGGSVRRGGRSWAAEAYGGRSLARALAEPRNEALRGLEDFLPDRSAWLLGGAVEASFTAASRVALRYQREILSDRSGLVSERAGLDARTLFFAPVALEGGADYDVAFGRVGKAHLAARWRPAASPLELEASLRRYLPYFELSTIWGMFSPVPYHEAGVRASWSGSPTGTAWARAAWRRYGDPDVVTVLSALQDQGWQAEVGASRRVGGSIELDGRYALDWGPGALLSAADVAVRWAARDRVELTASGTTFQQIEEFRLGDGRALGGGLSGRAVLGARTTVEAGASVLRHRDASWNQMRGWTQLTIALGEDPGLDRPRVRSTNRTDARAGSITVRPRETEPR